MDLYFQAAAVSLAGAAFAYLVYVMMTPAQMFAPMIEATNSKIQFRIDNAVNLDISLFNNGVAVPGTAVLPLLQDASTNNLAVFVQTRAQKGLVVNYGPQLRSAQASKVELDVYGYTGITSPTDFETNFVTTVYQLFNASGDTGAVVAGSKKMGSEALGGTGSYAGADDASAKYIALTEDTASPCGISFDTGLPSLNDPVLNFWDPFVPDYATAAKKGRTYSATGSLFTADILRTNMPRNDNRSFALTRGTVYHVNPGSNYYTTYIIDATQKVVGLYVEEHGCDAKGALLAEAMKACGYISETLN